MLAIKCNGADVAVTAAVDDALSCCKTSTRAFFATGWIGAIPTGGVIAFVGYVW